MKIELNMYITPEEGKPEILVQMEGVKGSEPSIKIGGMLDANYHSGVSCILEVVRCLLKEQHIDHFFNPSMKHEPNKEERFFKCQWMRSGKLYCIGETSKHYLHAYNLEDAMMRTRTFTCSQSLYAALPKRRLRTAADSKSRKPSPPEESCDTTPTNESPSETQPASE